MVFSSLFFLFVFLPIFLIIYYVVPFKFKNIILLLFSLFFYAWGEPIYIILLIFSSLINYYGSKLIRKAKVKKSKKVILIFVIILNLLL